MKNIILIRTSTVKQEVESQKKETIEYAKSFGAENIVIIGGVGASAIKLDDQYLFNIQQVYKLIDEGDVQLRNTTWSRRLFVFYLYNIEKYGYN